MLLPDILGDSLLEAQRSVTAFDDPQRPPTDPDELPGHETTAIRHRVLKVIQYPAHRITRWWFVYEN
jgi:hypothetical protein